jgi:hypothetical protein
MAVKEHKYSKERRGFEKAHPALILSVFLSSKFWIPFLVSMGITFLAALWMLMLLGAGGTHSRTSPIGIESLLFPFAAVVYGSTASFGTLTFLLTFFFQFPVYGLLVGAANFKGKMKEK